MTIEEISKYASTGTRPGKAMNCAERCLFYELKEIYSEYRDNRITRAMGDQRKQEAVKQYQKDMEELAFARKFLQHQGKMWSAIEKAGTDYRKEPSIEHADAFIEAVYGVGRMTIGASNE